MNGKPWWTSRTQVSVLVSAVLTVVATVFGISVPESTPIVDAIVGIGNLALLAMAALGRANQDIQPIDNKQVLPRVTLK